MKKILNIIAPLLLLAVSSCTKNTTPPATDNSDIPQGSYIGTFTLIHKNSISGKLDTSSANIGINFTLATTSFVVSGDTTKIQAGSHGTYTADGTYIYFVDATYNKILANTPKKHLNGTFLYSFTSANTLHIYGSSDTLSYNYNLTGN